MVTVDRASAQGASGCVHKGYLKNGASIAVKLAPRQFIEREARALRALSGSEYAPRFYGVKIAESADAEFSGRPLILKQEWMQGGAFLADLIEAVSPLGAPVPAVASIMQDGLLAVHYAETKGWIHNDLHPGNIYVTQNRVVFIDWGCATRKDEALSFIVKNGYNLGGAYMCAAADVGTLAASVGALMLGLKDCCPEPDALSEASALGRYLARCMRLEFRTAEDALVAFRQVDVSGVLLAGFLRKQLVDYARLMA